MSKIAKYRDLERQIIEQQMVLEALKNEKAAYWACVILREIGPAGKVAVPALAEKLKDPRPEIRREAALALGAMGGAAQPAAGQLAALLGDETMRPRILTPADWLAHCSA